MQILEWKFFSLLVLAKTNVGGGGEAEMSEQTYHKRYNRFVRLILLHILTAGGFDSARPQWLVLLLLSCHFFSSNSGFEKGVSLI